MKDESIRIHFYSPDFIQIDGKHIKAVSRVLMGFTYRIKYLDSKGTLKNEYFTPKGFLLSFFIEPASVRLLKSMIVPGS